ncbi:hypothetical protein [Ochrobactrum sp. BTU1]|jgi:hypothetical protein|uniref:hypothetical protein n=1 Tax=Ochrobactrum sp. BTU1 TaxID=2840456 RepID=UPI001C059B5B|nr:hypothetical protein KMS41_23205 [Ochrobactrum sp. BTU1]
MSEEENKEMLDADDLSEDEAMARALQKVMRLERRAQVSGDLKLKDTKRMLFGYPQNNPKQYLRLNDYEKAANLKVTLDEIKKHAIIVKVDDRPGGRYVPAFDTQRYAVVKDRNGNIVPEPKWNASKDEKDRHQKKKFKSDADLRREIGLPQEKEMKLEKKLNPEEKGFRGKDGKWYPKYKLSDHQMFYEDKGRNLRREYSYKNEHKIASGEWGAEVWAQRKDGSTQAYSFKANDDIDSHKKVLKHFEKPNTQIEEVYYKSYQGNSFMSKTEMDMKHISPQAFINEYTNKHPGPEVALKISNEMFDAKAINSAPQGAVLQDFLHGRKQFDGIEVMVKGRDGQMQHAQYVEADDPKHFKKTMEKHEIDPNTFAQMNGRPNVDVRTKTLENGKEVPLGSSAVKVRAEKTNSVDDSKAAIWYFDKDQQTWRGVSTTDTERLKELRSLLKDGSVTKADLLVGRQEKKGNLDKDGRENGPLNGHLKAFNAISDEKLPAQAKQVMDMMHGRKRIPEEVQQTHSNENEEGTIERKDVRSNAERAYASPEASPDRETFEPTYEHRDRSAGVAR